MEYIVLAIPVFFILIGLELVAARFSGRHVYRVDDTVNDISCGVGEQVVGAFTKTLVFLVYAGIYESWRWATIPTDTWWSFPLAVIAVDFCYYWFHRASHRVNAIWATHIVHHQSEEYNLAVALRQGSFQHIFSSFFYLPLALLGLSPLSFIAASAFVTLYQFWIHTQLIGRLGPIEWIFNTPSHHRVHHGRNPTYIDKNYAGLLIIWDRLFGTFEPEREEVVYGIVKPLRSWNPLWANLHHWVALWRDFRASSAWPQKLLVWVKPPGWRPADLPPNPPPPEVTPEGAAKYRAPAPLVLQIYAGVQFATTVLLATAFLMGFDELGLLRRLVVAGYILGALVVHGGLLDARPWASTAEGLRLVLFPLACWLVSTSAGMGLVVAGIGVIWSVASGRVHRRGVPGRQGTVRLERV